MRESTQTGLTKLDFYTGDSLSTPLFIQHEISTQTALQETVSQTNTQISGLIFNRYNLTYIHDSLTSDLIFSVTGSLISSQISTQTNLTLLDSTRPSLTYLDAHRLTQIAIKTLPISHENSLTQLDSTHSLSTGMRLISASTQTGIQTVSQTSTRKPLACLYTRVFIHSLLDCMRSVITPQEPFIHAYDLCKRFLSTLHQTGKRFLKVFIPDIFNSASSMLNHICETSQALSELEAVNTGISSSNYNLEFDCGC